MNTRQIIALASAALWLLGPSLRSISLPLVGSMNYFQNGHGDEVLVVGFAVLAAFGAFAQSRTKLLIAGIGSLAMLAFTFINFQSKMSNLHSSMDQDLGDNPFKGIADAMVQTVELQWGWAVVLIGAVGVLGCAIMKEQPPFLSGARASDGRPTPPLLYRHSLE